MMFIKRHPFAFGVTVACVKTAGMDYIVQKYVEKKDTLDQRRFLTFATFGLLFNGIFNVSCPRSFINFRPRMQILRPNCEQNLK